MSEKQEDRAVPETGRDPYKVHRWVRATEGRVEWLGYCVRQGNREVERFRFRQEHVEGQIVDTGVAQAAAEAAARALNEGGARRERRLREAEEGGDQ